MRSDLSSFVIDGARAGAGDPHRRHHPARRRADGRRGLLEPREDPHRQAAGRGRRAPDRGRHPGHGRRREGRDQADRRPRSLDLHPRLEPGRDRRHPGLAGLRRAGGGHLHVGLRHPHRAQARQVAPVGPGPDQHLRGVRQVEGALRLGQRRGCLARRPGVPAALRRRRQGGRRRPPALLRHARHPRPLRHLQRDRLPHQAGRPRHRDAHPRRLRHGDGERAGRRQGRGGLREHHRQRSRRAGRQRRPGRGGHGPEAHRPRRPRPAHRALPRALRVRGLRLGPHHPCLEEHRRHQRLRPRERHPRRRGHQEPPELRGLLAPGRRPGASDRGRQALRLAHHLPQVPGVRHRAESGRRRRRPRAGAQHRGGAQACPLRQGADVHLPRLRRAGRGGRRRGRARRR